MGKLSVLYVKGTAGLRVDELSLSKSKVFLKNRTRVQNHIGSLHACSMALAVESATGKEKSFLSIQN